MIEEKKNFSFKDFFNSECEKPTFFWGLFTFTKNNTENFLTEKKIFSQKMPHHRYLTGP